MANKDKVERINELVEELNEDWKKFTESGNNAAGTRARKTLKQIKDLAHETRGEIQERKKS